MDTDPETSGQCSPNNVASIHKLLDALMKGAAVIVADSSDTKIAALDDLPQNARECFRASRHQTEVWAQEHRRQCPDCIEAAARDYERDATSHQADGNLETAELLRVEAAERRVKAAKGRTAAKEAAHE